MYVSVGEGDMPYKNKVVVLTDCCLSMLKSGHNV